MSLYRFTFLGSPSTMRLDDQEVGAALDHADSNAVRKLVADVRKASGNRMVNFAQVCKFLKRVDD